MLAPRNGRRWTAAEVAQLRRFARRMTAPELARLLGRTVEAVRTKAAHERLPLPLDTARPGPPRAPLPWERPES